MLKTKNEALTKTLFCSEMTLKLLLAFFYYVSIKRAKH